MDQGLLIYALWANSMKNSMDLKRIEEFDFLASKGAVSDSGTAPTSDFESTRASATHNVPGALQQRHRFEVRIQRVEFLQKLALFGPKVIKNSHSCHRISTRSMQHTHANNESRTHESIFSHTVSHNLDII